MIVAAKPSQEKMLWIEGLRGLAALQVILLHYAATFLPVFARVEGVAHYGWEKAASTSPWFFVIDGNSAVYLFFIMSGFVLAQSFGRSTLNFWWQLVKRFLRLFLPVLAASMFALGLLLLVGSPKAAAYGITYSGWLNYNYQNPLTFLAVLKDFVLGSMLLGYDDLSLFTPVNFLKPLLPPIAMALDAPLWTLHIEFWGSLLVLGLIILKQTYASGFWMGCGALLVVFGTHPLVLFPLGVMLYFLVCQMPSPQNIYIRLFGVFLVGLGVFICGTKTVGWVEVLFQKLLPASPLHAKDNFYWQSEFGAILIFVGALVSRFFRKLLSTRPILWLGRMSFSLYLIHFPILYTLSLTFFVGLEAQNYALAITATTLAGCLGTFALAALFERYVDQTAIKLARRIAEPSQSCP
jgi:peptidoglycan/LPS O-acetylase OafA/YrhL